MDGMEGSAASASEQLTLTGTLHCSCAREAVAVADELRARSGARVAVEPSTTGSSCSSGWLVRLETSPPQLGAEELSRRECQIADVLEGWDRTCFLGWQLRPRQRRARATPAHGGDGRRRRSQRETVLASLACRPERRSRAA
jgi:hypothetical protein